MIIMADRRIHVFGSSQGEDAHDFEIFLISANFVVVQVTHACIDYDENMAPPVTWEQSKLVSNPIPMMIVVRISFFHFAVLGGGPARLTPFKGRYWDLEKCAIIVDADTQLCVQPDWGAYPLACVTREEPDWR